MHNGVLIYKDRSKNMCMFMCIFPSFVCQGVLEIMISRNKQPSSTQILVSKPFSATGAQGSAEKRPAPDLGQEQSEGTEARRLPLPEQGRAQTMMGACPKDAEVYRGGGGVPPAKFGAI